MTVDPKLVGALAESEWKREAYVSFPHIARVELTRRLESIRGDAGQAAAKALLDRITSVKNTAALADETVLVGYVDDPVAGDQVYPGRWRLVGNRTGRLKTNPGEQGIYQVLRLGYHETIDWEPEEDAPLVIQDALLTEPAAYSPDADSIVIKLVNLNPGKLQELAVAVPAQISNPVFLGQPWAGNWLKSRVDAYQDPEDGSGVLLIRMTKGGKEIDGMTLNSSCLFQSTFFFFWKYTKTELDQLVAAWTALPLAQGQVIEDPIIRFSPEREQFDITLIIRNYTGATGAVEAGGRRLDWGKYAASLPGLSGRRFLGGSVDKHDSCRFTYGLNSEDATPRQAEVAAGGRRVKTRTNQTGSPTVSANHRLVSGHISIHPDDKKDSQIVEEDATPRLSTVEGGGRRLDTKTNQAEDPEVAENHRLVGGNISIHPDGKRDSALMQEDATPREAEIEDEDRKTEVKTNQDEAPTIPEGRRMNRGVLRIHPDGPVDSEITHEDATPRKVTVEIQGGKGRKIVGQTNQTPTNDKIQLDEGHRLRSGNISIHPGGKTDVSATVQDTNNPHEITRTYGTVGRHIEEKTLAGANTENADVTQPGGKGVTNGLRLDLDEEGVVRLKKIMESTHRVGREGLKTGTALFPRTEKALSNADDEDIADLAEMPGVGVTRSVRLIPAEDDKFALQFSEENDLPGEIEEYVSRAQGALRVLTTKKRNSTDPLTLDVGQFGTCENILRDTNTIDAIRNVLALAEGYDNLIVNLKAQKNEKDERFTTITMTPTHTQVTSNQTQQFVRKNIYEMKRVYGRTVSYEQTIEFSLSPLASANVSAPAHGDKFSRTFQMGEGLWARETLTVTNGPWTKESTEGPDQIASLWAVSTASA